MMDRLKIAYWVSQAVYVLIMACALSLMYWQPFSGDLLHTYATLFLVLTLLIGVGIGIIAGIIEVLYKARIPGRLEKQQGTSLGSVIVWLLLAFAALWFFYRDWKVFHHTPQLTDTSSNLQLGFLLFMFLLLSYNITLALFGLRILRSRNRSETPATANP